MQLEDYFDFQRPDDIRLKGTRVGIETILMPKVGKIETYFPYLAHFLP